MNSLCHRAAGAPDSASLSATAPAIGSLQARLLYAAAVLALGPFASVTTAGPVRSVGVMTFIDADTDVIPDWRASELHALRLPPAARATSKPFNLKNVSAPIAHALRTPPDQLRFEDMAFRPGAELVYITLSVKDPGSTPWPALVAVDAAGKVAVVDLRRPGAHRWPHRPPARSVSPP